MKVCWNITSRCNKNCKYCFKFSKSDLSLEDNKRILNKLVMMGVEKISWTGGEPFLYKDFVNLLKLSKEYGLINHVNTNTSILDYELLKECLAYIDKINISLDFVDDRLNSKYGIGENYYEHVKKILGYIKELNPKVKIQINTVIFNGNINHYKDLYNEICKYNINYWKIIRFFPIRGKALKEELKLSITDEEFDNVCSWIRNKKTNFNVIIHGLKEMKEKHFIVLSSGELVCSENLEDIVINEKFYC